MRENTRARIKTPILISGQEYQQLPLAGLTTWNIGGPADRLYIPKNAQDWSDYIKASPEQDNITCLGLGSNVLISDKGVEGTIIYTLPGLQQLMRLTPHLVRAEVGVSSAKFARFAGVDSMAFFAGVPGTVGGALAMNAGAFGGETWQFVHSVEFLDVHGQLHTLTPDQFTIGYRQVEPPMAGWFVAATFDTSRLSKVSALPIRALLKKRKESQPIGQRTCGSVYRNPPGDFAARLIEGCGLKGHRIGDALISEKHANFIVNMGEATSDDVLNLIRLIAHRVLNEFNTVLESEVRLLGRFDK